MRSVGFAIGLVTSVALLEASALAADYSAAGPEKFTVNDLPSGLPASGKLIVPGGAGPYPLLIASHGFGGSPTNQVGWAKHFASYGFVVAVPDLGLIPDHTENPKKIVGIVAKLRDPNFASAAKGKVDPTLLALEGHSAGGLATAVATKELKPNVTVLFDPVDANSLGAPAMAGICGPLIEMFSNPGSCNSNGNWKGFSHSSKGPLIAFNVKDSTHCDGENTSRSVCGTFCGSAGADAARQGQFARYATAFMLTYLRGDKDAADELRVADLKQNSAVVQDTLTVLYKPNCNPAPGVDVGGGVEGGGINNGGTDGGGTPNSSTVDGGTAPGSSNSGKPGDTPSGSDADPDANAPAGCGCAVVGRDRGSALGAVGLALIGVVVRLRRRRAR